MNIKLFFMILYWVVLFIVSMIINVLSLILGPIIALWSLFKPVPKIFNWFLTHDCGIDGEEGHYKRWPGESHYAKFLRRTAWLWRNKGYTFDYQVCGRILGNHLTNHGNPDTTDNGVAGYIFQYDENYTWEFYFIYPYPFKPERCLRLRFGWKINDGLVGQNERMMIATSIGIWKSFRKPQEEKVIQEDTPVSTEETLQDKE